MSRVDYSTRRHEGNAFGMGVPSQADHLITLGYADGLVSAAASDVEKVVGNAVSLTTTDQVAASIGSATASNSSSRPRVAMCTYMCTFTGAVSS